MNKLSPKALGLSVGILWAAGIVFMGLSASVCGWAKPFVEVVAVMYKGYSVGIIGNIIGALWGFVDGFVGGFCVAWLYNQFV